jgi:hypothetical protein
LEARYSAVPELALAAYWNRDGRIGASAAFLTSRVSVSPETPSGTGQHQVALTVTDCPGASRKGALRFPRRFSVTSSEFSGSATEPGITDGPGSALAEQEKLQLYENKHCASLSTAKKVGSNCR